MSKKFIPFEKLSKKKQKEILKANRKPPIPAPKVVPDKHKKQKDKERSRYDFV